MIRRLIVIFLCLCFLSSCSEDDYMENLYHMISVIDSIEIDSRRCNSYFNSIDYDNARSYCERSVKRGDIDALYNLGTMYLLGKGGLLQDSKKALKLYQKSARKGNVNAQYKLGEIYFFGYKNIPQNFKKSFKWYKKAGVQNHPESLSKLGEIYEKGLGVKKDHKLSIEMYEKACVQGVEKDCYNLGYVNNSIFSNKEECSSLIASKEDYLAKPYCVRAAYEGDTISQYNLGIMYSKGEGGIQDDQKAVYWLETAALKGDIDAQYSLGALYTDIRKPKKAVYWMRKAAAQGDADAQYDLGERYYDGRLTRDYKKAVEWYQKAAKQGHVYAKLALGKMYEKGEGVTKNLSLAKKMYEEACKSKSIGCDNLNRLNNN